MHRFGRKIWSRREARFTVGGLFREIVTGLLLVVLVQCASGETARAIGIGEQVQIPQGGVVITEGTGGPLPSSTQISQLGTLITGGFNQETTVLGMLLQELAKKSLDTEALLRGIGEYFRTTEVLLKDLQKTALTQAQVYENRKEEVFGTTPFTCSDGLAAQALKDARKTMRTFSRAMKDQRVADGEGTRDTEVRAEEAVARELLRIMQQEMTEGRPDAQKIPSGASMFPYSGVISQEGGRVFQAVISAANAEPMPAIRNAESFSGRRALELQGIKLGRIAGIQEGMQIAFDLQNAVINGQAFSQMQAELNQEVGGKPVKEDEYIEAGYQDGSGAISILQALTHQFERARIANPDWYEKIDHGGMTVQGLLRELLKIEAWRGYMETQSLRISMVNAYNIAQQTAILVEQNDNPRMVQYVYPNGDAPTQPAAQSVPAAR